MVMKSLMKMTGSEWAVYTNMDPHNLGLALLWQTDSQVGCGLLYFDLTQNTFSADHYVEGQRSLLNDYHMKVSLDHETLKSEHVTDLSDTHISLIRESDVSLLSTSRQDN